MQQEGRIAWTQLALRAQVEGAWTQAIPDVFSIRHTKVEANQEPVLHEIKVSRANLLGDLKRPEKRAAYPSAPAQPCRLGKAPMLVSGEIRQSWSTWMSRRAVRSRSDAGASLAQRLEQPTKWRFPSASTSPGKRAVAKRLAE